MAVFGLHEAIVILQNSYSPEKPAESSDITG